jgi:hypothetical protein
VVGGGEGDGWGGCDNRCDDTSELLASDAARTASRRGPGRGWPASGDVSLISKGVHGWRSKLVELVNRRISTNSHSYQEPPSSPSISTKKHKGTNSPTHTTPSPLLSAATASCNLPHPSAFHPQLPSLSLPSPPKPPKRPTPREEEQEKARTHPNPLFPTPGAPKTSITSPLLTPNSASNPSTPIFTSSSSLCALSACAAVCVGRRSRFFVSYCLWRDDAVRWDKRVLGGGGEGLGAVAAEADAM